MRGGGDFRFLAILFFAVRQGRCCGAGFFVVMLPLARAALGRTAQDIWRISARQVHRKHEPDFHDKYGNVVLIGGTVFCLAVWTYVATQAGIEWGLSPIGRVTPKEWRED